ncbi:MAG: outer membrane protein assembly factor BamD [Flavobacteriales bacterium]|jgi:outer membrane protein assembly factor BamD|nr:outer membrane protein assembly factor BamD [Flavobacteriales bacterium]MBK6552078.1 outer membrane protein assembly factor BamD [Flavobacteriales bacterium]MBK6883115.1 outer membrane protein assembly factor BamD [Flavobacteriales bacterium]MBK7103152.1 outer membrane protein assembly factor BamD [Flavobacteriales bacterium]MBK7112872.1 outer membrane protein assembly factor BamD [Flavobacteriales bacterium]
MQKLLILFLFAALLPGCSEFNKALKSTDLDYKMQVAEKYIAKESYDRAIPLLEELIVLTRGSERSEKVNYLHAHCTYLMKDYTLAAYYLANFVRTFPKSQYAEECAFLSAYCQYQNSPGYELDQSDTRNAMEQMQLFLVRYPNSSLKDSCNTLIDGMRTKLEAKAFHGAQQYHKMRNYQASSVAFKNFNREWPNSKYREDALFFILKSDHELALNSVESKKLERLNEAIKSYHNFADAFPQSVLLPDALKLNKNIEAALDLETRKTIP